MARPKSPRKMVNPPTFKGVKPYGCYSVEQEPIIMLFEEYEAIRLCDYKLLTQSEAAKLMNVSRPTITRIYECARRKVAAAFAETRVIAFEGGKVYFDDKRFNNINCESFIKTPDSKKETNLKKCHVGDSKQKLDMCED